jgi:hypothetical protein
VNSLSWEDLLVILEGVCSESVGGMSSSIMSSKEEWSKWLCGWFRLLYHKLEEVRDTLLGASFKSSTSSFSNHHSSNMFSTNGRRGANNNSSSHNNNVPLMPERLVEKIKKLKIFPLIQSSGTGVDLACLKDGSIYMASKEFKVKC